MPALLTRMSQRPPFLSTSSLSLATLAGSLMSHWTATALPPAALTACSVSSALARSAITICAPSSARRTADACPMPDAAPEITAILPWCLLLIPRNLHCSARDCFAQNGFAGEGLDAHSRLCTCDRWRRQGLDLCENRFAVLCRHVPRRLRPPRIHEFIDERAHLRRQMAARWVYRPH